MGNPTDSVLTYLEESIEDEIFSKSERRSLKSLINEVALDQNQLNYIRSKIFELAHNRINSENYQFILQWVKNATNSLNYQSNETSVAFFSPGDECRNAIIHQINSAIKSLKICVFTISDDLITQALLTAHQKGVDILIITDNDKSTDKGSDIRRMASKGIAVKTDDTPDHMHHKFMITDDTMLITGSYNWTRSAARYNHENIIQTSEAGIIRSYLKEFGNLWKSMNLYFLD